MLKLEEEAYKAIIEIAKELKELNKNLRRVISPESDECDATIRVSEV